MRSPGLRAICYFRFAPRKGKSICAIQRKGETALMSLIGRIRRQSPMRIKRSITKDRYVMGRMNWMNVLGMKG